MLAEFSIQVIYSMLKIHMFDRVLEKLQVFGNNMQVYIVLDFFSFTSLKMRRSAVIIQG